MLVLVQQGRSEGQRGLSPLARALALLPEQTLTLYPKALAMAQVLAPRQAGCSSPEIAALMVLVLVQ